VSAIVDALARVHHADPHRPLIHLPGAGRALSADDLWQLYLACVDGLRAAGIRPGHVVLSAAGNRPGFVAVVVACRAMDLVLVPMDAGTTMPEIAELTRRLGAVALILPAGTAGIGGTPSLPLVDGLVLMRSDSAAIWGPPSGGPSATGAAVMKLTSGSTAAPKATITTEAQLIADARQIMDGMRIGPDDTQICAIPLSHSYGMSVILMPLLLQGTPIVMRDSFAPAQLPSDARACGARVFPGVPFMFQHFLAHQPADGWPRHTRKLISAGARLPAETSRDFHAAFGVKIHSFYGTTETGGIAYDDSEAMDDLDTIGPPLPGVTIACVPQEGTPDGTGRIFVRSAAVSSGYAGERHELFRDGGYLTGDYGALDERGRLRIAGRVSSFVNVAGKKVEPEEVERVLRQMPGVRDACVSGAADAQRGEQVVACIVAATGVTAFAVRQFCSGRLAPHKIPRTILLVEAIPTTPRGKVDRQALDALVAARIAGSA
jgi:long-chain acyl-CoA synthetase